MSRHQHGALGRPRLVALAHEVDPDLVLVGVGPLLVEQRGPVGLGLGRRPGLGAGQGLVRRPRSWTIWAHSTSASTISSSGTTLTTLPFTNRWPRLRPAAMPRSASRASPGPFTTQPMTATWMGMSSSLSASCAALATCDHVDLGPPARRAGDEVEALALAQTEGLEQLAAGARLLDRIGGERVADGVADALRQQRGHAGGGLDEAGRRRSRPRSPRGAAGSRPRRTAGGRPRSSAARSTP